MIKLIAAVLIVGGSVLSGCCAASLCKRRTDILSGIVMMISFIQTHLRYECLPIDSLLSSLAENVNPLNCGFVASCRERVIRGEDFAAAWRESIESDSGFCFLLRKEMPHLIHFGEALGTTDLEGQLSLCSRYEKIFADEKKNAEDFSKKHSKVYPALGATLGVWAAILII